MRVHMTFYRFCCCMILMAFVGGCAGNQLGYTSGETRDIDCREFPFKIKIDSKIKHSLKCARRYTDDTAFVGIKYRISVRFYSGSLKYANIIYADTGQGTVILHKNVKEKMLGFKSIREKGSEFGNINNINEKNRQYQYINFFMPNNRFCIGYINNYDYDGGGYRRVFYGYICSTRKVIDVSDLRVFLSYVDFD